MDKRRGVIHWVKQRKRVCAGTLCLTAGIALLLTPYVREHLQNQRQQALLEGWKEEKKKSGDRQKEMTEEEEAESESELIVQGEPMVGILKIPVIDLEEPILKEATNAHLNVSIATVEPTGEPGQNGNFAISGHNSRSYGRHFNRLLEVQNGDEIIVEARVREYVYEVVDTYMVKPEEVWVLEKPAEGAEITLITCCYPENGEEARWIVKGMLK